MRFDDLEVYLVNAGTVRTDVGGSFGLVPRKLYVNYIRPALDNTISMNLLCMFVRSRARNILVDTGLGSKLNEGELSRWQLQRLGDGILEPLSMIGVRAEDIDIVINTHLHADHCGGNTYIEKDRIEATFPNAQYWVQRMEWADASHPDERTKATYKRENFSPLLRDGRLLLLHGDTAVTDQVQCVVTPGHTRGHQSILLRSGTWRGLFLSEVAPFAVNLSHTAWLAAFDVDPLRSLETKQRWQRWAIETGAWLFFQHDPSQIVGRLVRENGQLQVKKIEGAKPLIDAIPTP